MSVYVNECNVHVRARLSRPVEAGEGIFQHDLVDMDALVFEGVHVPSDAGVLYLFSAGWRKGLFLST